MKGGKLSAEETASKWLQQDCIPALVPLSSVLLHHGLGHLKIGEGKGASGSGLGSEIGSRRWGRCLCS